MAEASIVFKAYDEITDAFRSIEDGSQRLDKELEIQQRKLRQLGDRWSAFTEQEAKVSAEALKVKNAMDAAKKAFKASGEEADQVKFEKLRAQYKGLTADARAYGEAADLTRRTMKDTAEYARKMGAGGGSSSKGGSMLAQIGQAGGFAMAGQYLGQWAGVLGGSALGSVGSGYLGGALSGAGSGAAIGSMIAPGVGTAVGAAIGGVVGLAGGAAEHFQSKDEAFKSYVRQSTEEQLSAMEQSKASGSAMSAGREMDAVSFATLLGGEEKATDYLGQLVSMANNTPFLYGDLISMSKAMAPYADKDGARMLRELGIIGDTGAALGHSTADMQTVGVVLGRMRTSDRANLEDFNQLSDRGIGVIDMMAQAKGVKQDQLYDLISAGKISGEWAADVILKGMTEAFKGSMAKQSGTFAGLSSTVEGLTQELDAAMGDAYNQVRKKGLEDQRDWLSSTDGQRLADANTALGEWKAQLDNQKDAMVRNAISEAMKSPEYLQAERQGNAVDMARIRAQAEISARNDFMASEGAQQLAAMETQLAQGIREDAALNKEGWMIGWRRNDEYTKGWMSAWDAHPVPATPKMDNGHIAGSAMHGSGYATGLRRVPFDGFPARLHQGERVLTAHEARQLDRRSGTPAVTVNVGSMSVRTDDDIDAVAGRLAQLIQSAAVQDGGM